LINLRIIKKKHSWGGSGALLATALDQRRKKKPQVENKTEKLIVIN
jgi:hypothetical protein